MGKGDRRSVNLEIEFPPVITVPRSRMSQAVRNDIDLECHVEAYPPPQVSRELFQSFFLLRPLNRLTLTLVNTPQLNFSCFNTDHMGQRRFSFIQRNQA